MMKRFFSLAVGVLCLCAALQAEVPSLINYQGRLTDSGGTPVNGAIDVVLRVYDAKTEGKMVYEETISQVSVVNGVYSFGYGSAGKTVKRAAEVVAVADGETKVFNYTTEYKPLLGDVQLSDGSYTWGTLSGPSDATQFIGSVNAELGNVTGIYIQNAPDADKIVNVVYHYHEEGIVGALSQNKECWQELTINGKTLSPRERLVSVPFAQVAGELSQTFKNIYGFNYKWSEAPIWGSASTELYTAKANMLIIGNSSSRHNNNRGGSVGCEIVKNGISVRSHSYGEKSAVMIPIKKGESFRFERNNITVSLWVIEFN